MPRDSAATRARILEAAVQEFAAHGLGGGRVERIATASRANPRSIYVYFGSKERLFYAAVYEVLHAVGVAVPLTEDDLPGWAGRTFDWITSHPEAVRLNNWRMLEAPEAGPDDSDDYARAVARMTADKTYPIPPADLLILVANMAAAWVSTSRDLQAADGRDAGLAERVADHRAALVEAVRLLSGGS